MATRKSGKQPLPPLEPKVVRRFLDLMSTDNEFRRLFKKDAQAALVKAGWKPPKGPPDSIPPAYGKCMQMKPGQSIASKEQIARDRRKYEALMTSEFDYTIPFHASS